MRDPIVFDSHCHLTDAAFVGEVSALLARARAAGVQGVVSIASDAADARRALALAVAHEGVWASAGIHPHTAAAATAADMDAVQELLAEAKVVAVGETGLDYHYDNSPRGVQRERFGWQLELAEASGKPVVVHSREADEDTASLIVAHPRAPGILHCFSGGERLLRAGLDAGWYISFAGPVTFKRFAAGELVRAVPDDRLLIETDAPYLAPVPHRGKRNEPSFLRHTCAAVAAMRGVPFDWLSAQVARNARACYGLGPG